jgi:hypothetical protein
MKVKQQEAHQCCYETALAITKPLLIACMGTSTTVHTTLHSSDVICFGTLFWNGKKLQSVSKVEVIVQQPKRTDELFSTQERKTSGS